MAFLFLFVDKRPFLPEYLMGAVEVCQGVPEYPQRRQQQQERICPDKEYQGVSHSSTSAWPKTILVALHLRHLI